MEIYYSIVFFIFGTIFGSFFNVVGDRLPEGKSIVFPSSHCTKCNHKLKVKELIPIISYIIQKGRCTKCKAKIPILMPLFELASGLLFMGCYLKFGMTIDIIIPITFISMLLILIVSDYNYMIIPDEVLIFFLMVLFIEMFFIYGINYLLARLLDGVIAFGVMFLIKLLGDFMFKKESMGGGDIKLLFFFGFICEWQNALLSIFYGAVIALPISIIITKRKKSHIIPFGPFLAIGIMIILFTKLDINFIFDTMTK